MKIRAEYAGEAQAIDDLTARAFDGMAHSGGNEARIVQRLRHDGDLFLSLVAVLNRAIAGHVAFSPVEIDGAGGGWYGLGPISVQPELQRNGIGSALVTEGLARLKDAGASGCVLIGDPKFYARFGFISDGQLKYKDVPDRYVQWLSFGNAKAAGQILFSPGFDA